MSPKLSTLLFFHTPISCQLSGLFPGLRPVDERRRNEVTPSHIGWVQTYGSHSRLLCDIHLSIPYLCVNLVSLEVPYSSYIYTLETGWKKIRQKEMTWFSNWVMWPLCKLWQGYIRCNLVDGFVAWLKENSYHSCKNISAMTPKMLPWLSAG